MRHSTTLKAQISGLAATRVDISACALSKKWEGGERGRGAGGRVCDVRMLSEPFKQAISRLGLGSVRWT